MKKSIALACGLPYVVAFKDVEQTSYAGFRAAMLDAWRVFSMDRVWHGRYLAQPLFTMLMEEAYLRGEIPYPAFYRDLHELTRCEWRGAPKGNIEPVKEIQVETFERIAPSDYQTWRYGQFLLVRQCNRVVNLCPSRRSTKDL